MQTVRLTPPPRLGTFVVCTNRAAAPSWLYTSTPNRVSRSCSPRCRLTVPSAGDCSPSTSGSTTRMTLGWRAPPTRRAIRWSSPPVLLRSWASIHPPPMWWSPATPPPGRWQPRWGRHPSGAGSSAAGTLPWSSSGACGASGQCSSMRRERHSPQLNPTITGGPLPSGVQWSSPTSWSLGRQRSSIAPTPRSQSTARILARAGWDRSSAGRT